MSKCEDYKINCDDCPIKDICHTHEQYDVGNILLEVYDSGVKQGRADVWADIDKIINGMTNPIDTMKIIIEQLKENKNVNRSKL